MIESAQPLDINAQNFIHVIQEFKLLFDRSDMEQRIKNGVYKRLVKQTISTHERSFCYPIVYCDHSNFFWQKQFHIWYPR